MNEVRILYGPNATGGWSATISGDFADRCEGATRAEASRRVAAALASQGASYPRASSAWAPPSGSETVVYA